MIDIVELYSDHQLLLRKLDLWRSCLGNENSEALWLFIMEVYYGFLSIVLRIPGPRMVFKLPKVFTLSLKCMKNEKKIQKRFHAPHVEVPFQC